MQPDIRFINQTMIKLSVGKPNQNKGDSTIIR